MSSSPIWWLPESFFLRYKVTGENAPYRHVKIEFNLDNTTKQVTVKQAKLSDDGAPIEIPSLWVLRPVEDTAFFQYFSVNDMDGTHPQSVALPVIDPKKAAIGMSWRSKSRRIEVKGKEFLPRSSNQIECWRTESTLIESTENPNAAWYDCACGLLVQLRFTFFEGGMVMSDLWTLEETDVKDFNEYLNSPLSMSDPLNIVLCCESATRDLITRVLDREYGAQWWNEFVPREIAGNVAGRRKKREEGSLKILPEIEYTTFGELSGIINRNNEVFAKVTDVPKLLIHLNKIVLMRNTKIGHGKERMTRPEFLELQLEAYKLLKLIDGESKPSKGSEAGKLA